MPSLRRYQQGHSLLFCSFGWIITCWRNFWCCLQMLISKRRKTREIQFSFRIFCLLILFTWRSISNLSIDKPLRGKRTYKERKSDVAQWGFWGFQRLIVLNSFSRKVYQWWIQYFSTTFCISGLHCAHFLGQTGCVKW